VNQSITQFLTQLVPLNQIVQILSQVQMAFVGLAVMILCVGLIMKLAGSEEVLSPISSIMILMACVGISPWLLTLVQEAANGLVGVIVSADPALAWIPVNNPNSSSLALNYSHPFQVIGAYVAGKTGAPPAAGLVPDLGAWADYLTRVIIIAITGIVAAFTVAVMMIMLILQKLILLFSGVLLPLFLALLSIPATRGSAQNFLKSLVGVCVWPVGWAVINIGTQAALQNLQPPNWNASLGELLLSFIVLAVICLWMVVGTVASPMLIARTVTSGSNFAAEMWSNYASSVGHHASSGIKSAASVGGALVGSAMGPGGAMAGASVGGAVGGMMSSPISAATQSADGVNGGRQALPSSRSAEAADAAIKEIAKRSDKNEPVAFNFRLSNGP
jgi:hypothetical protein